MADALAIADGGYAYLPGARTPFSNGVVALDGYAFTRVRLRRPLPLAEGLAFAAAFVQEHGRAPASLAACELRSPAALSLADFAAFNAQYAELLRANGLGAADGFPVARSNMAPMFDPPSTNTLVAFTFAAPTAGTAGSNDGRDFVISGKPENTSMDPSGIVAGGDTSAAGMAAKARYVITELKSRVAALGADWSDITASQIYTVQSLDSVLELLGAHGLASRGLTLVPGHPPVVGFEFEVDVRGMSIELLV